MTKQTLETRVKVLLWFFIIALLLSGITAFPLEWELSRLNQIVNGAGSPLPVLWPEMTAWIAWVNTGIQDTARQYPFIAYGTDWLAFAHIVIAIAFWGPLRDPVRNLWVIEWGMIACVLVIPLALIFGPIRGIPFFHRLIDCSFGVVGIIPLWIVRNMIRQMAHVESISRVVSWSCSRIADYSTTRLSDYKTTRLTQPSTALNPPLSRTWQNTIAAGKAGQNT